MPGKGAAEMGTPQPAFPHEQMLSPIFSVDGIVFLFIITLCDIKYDTR